MLSIPLTPRREWKVPFQNINALTFWKYILRPTVVQAGLERSCCYQVCNTKMENEACWVGHQKWKNNPTATLCKPDATEIKLPKEQKEWVDQQNGGVEASKPPGKATKPSQPLKWRSWRRKLPSDRYPLRSAARHNNLPKNPYKKIKDYSS